MKPVLLIAAVVATSFLIASPPSLAQAMKKRSEVVNEGQKKATPQPPAQKAPTQAAEQKGPREHGKKKGYYTKAMAKKKSENK